MDSKRFNIYAGSILGGVLLFLLLNFFSELIYIGPPHPPEGEPLAFAVAVDEGTEEAEEQVDLVALAAEAEPGAGERVFNKCKACHSVEQGDHGVGPSLHNVVGSDIASTEGFSYSDALTGLEGAWDLETLSAFLENPQGYASGTKMSFAGVPDPEDRVNVIAFLNQQGGSPIELVPERTAAAEETATDAAAEETAEAAPEEAEETTKAEGAAEETTQDPGEATTETAEATAEETGQPAEEEAEEASGGEYAELLANASAENGEKVFRKCQACHTLEEGKHRVGPSLHGVVGSDIGSAEGFGRYSDAMAEFEGTWTLSKLEGYIENPNEFMPGNKMPFPGLKDAQDRIDVITYINQADDSPVDLSAGAEPAAAEATEEEAAQETGPAEDQEAEAETEQAAGDDGEQAAGEGAGDQAGGEFAELLANASAEEGQKVYRKCQACHTLDEGKHRVGPSLYGVIGREAAAAEGFNYSDALAAFDETWTLSNLEAYLENPREFIPGNRMSFPGLRDPQDRIDVLIYIDESDGERDLPQ